MFFGVKITNKDICIWVALITMALLGCWAGISSQAVAQKCYFGECEPKAPSQQAIPAPPQIAPPAGPTAPRADDASKIIARLGRPDRDNSTEYEQPRPPVVSRWLDYPRQNVRVWLVPTNRVGDPPPYTWKLLGFFDIAKQQRISPDEVARRFNGR